MAYRTSTSAIASSTSATSVQLVVPVTAEVGDVLLFVCSRTGTSTTSDFGLVSSNGGAFTQREPDAGQGSIGTTSKYAVFSRTAVAGDAGSTVTVSTGTTAGRWAAAVVALSGVQESSIVVDPGATPSTSANYITPSLSPLAGSTAGDVVRVALASQSVVGLTPFAAPSGHTLREETGNAGSTGQNLRLGVATSTFTGDGAVGEATFVGQSTANRAPLTILLSGFLTPAVAATAPADLSRQVSSEPFALTGTATPSGGAAITGRLWTRVSGVVVTLANTATDTVTVTPPASVGAGSTTLRYAVTGTPGTLTAQDDVVVTWTAASTGPIPYTQGPGWIRTTYGAVSLVQTGGSGVSITEAAEGVFLLSGPGTFLLTADNGLADPTTVTVAGAGGVTGPRVTLWTGTATGWTDGTTTIPYGA